MTHEDTKDNASEDRTDRFVFESIRGSKRVGRLMSLEILRFKNVRSSTKLRFDDGLNVLLGRNGTGKTTLLELVGALVSGDLRAYRTEEFDLSFELEVADAHFQVSARNEKRHSARRSLTNLMQLDSEDTDWSYEISFRRGASELLRIEADPSRTLVRKDVDSEEVEQHPESSLFASEFYSRCVSQCLVAPGDPIPAFAVLHKSLANNCLRLDEGLDLFRGMTEGEPLPRLGGPLAASLIKGYPWDNPTDGLLPKLIAMFSGYVPFSVLDCLFEQGDRPHEATELSVTHEDWAPLEVLRAALGVRDVVMTVRLVNRKEGEGGPTISNFGEPVFRITTYGGATFNHGELSYGEKRLLVFLWHAATNPDILIADELVNGLHHEWIQTCLDAIQGQAFLTSQNPLLLDHLPFESADEVRRRFVLCDRDDEGNWIWRNMSEELAGSFYRAYEVGIQHVSEILRTKGMW